MSWFRTGRAPRSPLLAVVHGMAVMLVACGGSGASKDTEEPPTIARTSRIYSSPYAAVDWAGDLWLKTQHHDHVRVNLDRIRAYDDAAYDAIMLGDYSGAPNLDYALKSVLWPPEEVLPPSFIASLRSIKFFIPSVEMAGNDEHFTAQFMTTYVEKWLPAYSPVKQTWQYETIPEMGALIEKHGGLFWVAHPWIPQTSINALGVTGTEMYSAFADAQRLAGVGDYVSVDRNQVLLENWDRALVANQNIVGIAVNDHFGPLPDRPTSAAVRDSGKTLVLAKAATPSAYREAIERRAVFAVRDQGVQKNRFPIISGVTIDRDSATVQTDGTVAWISRGNRVATGSSLAYSLLPADATYVRAEISNQDGSVTLFSQAFPVRPVGDIDGDADIDAADREICVQVQQGADTNDDHVRACAALANKGQ